MDRRHFLVQSAAWLCLADAAKAQQREPVPVTRTPQRRLINAARQQIGQTTRYVPAYTRIAYPGGDIPREIGVCTDVVVRAYRDALGLDLQKLVHEDMRAHFGLYPKRWGLARPDPNIDHRRVPNLQVFFARMGQSLPVTSNAADYQPGELVTQMLPGNLPHIGIVTDKLSAITRRPTLVHNIGRGTLEEDVLMQFPITGRYVFAL
jgi:uncharacterized protein